jgi:putative DNA methylase
MGICMNKKPSNKTLIEAFFPSEELSEDATKEEADYAPTFKIHYWWKRKLLVIARAAVLGTLLSPEYNILDFKGLLGLGANKPAHANIINTNQIKKLRHEYTKVWGHKNPVLLDPFAGSGSIPFEAMSVGLKVISNDYNPVAYLIQKATLEYPRKYQNKLYNDVKEGLEWVSEEANKELGSFYPKHDSDPTAEYIWAWMVRCPKCGFDNPFLSQWWLMNNDKSYIYMQSAIINGKLTIEIVKRSDVSERTCSGDYVNCLSCGSEITSETAYKDIAEREKEKLLAVVLIKSGVKEYATPSSEDLEAFERTNEVINGNLRKWIEKDFIPVGEKRDVIWSKFYLNLWYKLLNSRQKLVFFTLIENIHKYVKLISNKYDSNYVEAITTYLSFIFGVYIYNNFISITWKQPNDITVDVFAPRGIAMRWIEVNPFEKGPGTFFDINKLIIDGIKYSAEKLAGKGNIRITNNSITYIKEKVDIIITDPPYFDDLPYAELSEIFYAWERKALLGVHNLGDILKDEEMSVYGDRDREFFHQLFKFSCGKMHECLKDDGILVIIFPHFSIDTWDFLINSLIKVNFRITAAWSIYPKNVPTPTVASSLVPLIIVVARKRISAQYGYIEKEEFEMHLTKHLDEFWGYGFRGINLTVSAFGSILDIITRCPGIENEAGKMDIKSVIVLVQKYVIKYILNKYTNNLSRLDPQTSFYLYSRLSDLDVMTYDVANLISQSLNFDLKKFEYDGLIQFIDKEKSNMIKILKFNERIYNNKNSLIDLVHSFMTTYEKSGSDKVKEELINVPYSIEDIKDILIIFDSLPPDDIECKTSLKVLENIGYPL